MNNLRIRRFTPLWVSVVFAASFLAIRVFYRIIFGSFSVDSVLGALSLAWPFAAVIVGCGLISSLVDVRRFLVASSSLKLGRSLSAALAISLASIPSLLTTAHRQRVASRLRGLNAGPRLLLPLMESALERSLALAAAMDMRGFGSRHQAGHGNPPTIEARDFGVCFGSNTVLRDVTLTIHPGDMIVLAGPTGSGKTTLLESIAGLTQHFHGAHTTGQLFVGDADRSVVLPRDLASVVSYVPQHPRTSFTSVTVAEEVAFGLRMQGFSKEDALGRVHQLASKWELEELLPSTLEMLSAGQAMRVAIVAAIATSPRILLLDEPLAELDEHGRAEIIELLQHLRDSGLTVVIAEHHLDPFEALNPLWFTVTEGTFRVGKWAPTPETSLRHTSFVGNDPVLEISYLRVVRETRTLLTVDDLITRAGEITAITGANGVGKSSFLSDLALPHKDASVTVLGTRLPEVGRRNRAGYVALIPEQVSDFFQTTSLADELALADRAAHVAPGLTELTLRSILSPSWDLDFHRSRHPRDLSAGTQLALALAIQLSHKPAVVLIDEPSRGLDPEARIALAEVLQCVAETGTSIIFATHDREFVRSIADREFAIENAVLREKDIHRVEVRR